MRKLLVALNLGSASLFVALAVLAATGIPSASRARLGEPEDFYGLVVATGLCLLFAASAVAVGVVLMRGSTVSPASRRRTAAACIAVAIVLGLAGAVGVAGDRFKTFEIALLIPGLVAACSAFVVSRLPETREGAPPSGGRGAVSS